MLSHLKKRRRRPPHSGFVQVGLYPSKALQSDLSRAPVPDEPLQCVLRTDSMDLLCLDATLVATVSSFEMIENHPDDKVPA